MGDASELIGRFAAACAGDDRIVAALVTGSHARNEADEHSDVDLCVVTTDAAFESVLADRSSLIGRLGAPLFFETFGHPTNVHFILADGAEGELLCVPESGLARLDVGPFRGLVDKRGILGAAEFPFAQPDADEQREQATRILLGFWHDLSHLIAGLGRRDLWWAAGQLDALRGACVNLVRIRHGTEAGDEPYEKLGTTVPNADVAALAPTFVPLEARAMLNAALVIVAHFRQVGHLVAAQHGVEYPDELDRLMSRRLEGLHIQSG